MKMRTLYDERPDRGPPGSPIDRNDQLKQGNWFETQLILSLAIGTFSILTFCYSRSRSSLTFAPRTHLSSFSPHPVHLSSGFFSWIIPTLKTSEQTVLEIVGLDAVVLLYFFKLGFYYFMACTFFAFVILVPINIHENGSTEGVPPDRSPPVHMERQTFKAQSLFSDNETKWEKLFDNVTLYHSSHLLFTYFFTLMLLRLLEMTYIRFITIKPIFSLAHHASVPLRTVSIENLPLHLQNDDALFDYFNDLLGFEVESVSVVRDVSGLVQLLNRRTVALRNLEKAWTRWLGNPVKPSSVKNYSPQTEAVRIMSWGHQDDTEDICIHSLPAQRIQSDDQVTTPHPRTVSPRPLFPQDQTPALISSCSNRPTYRPSWFSLKKVDLIDHTTAEFQEADELVKRRRKGKFRCTSTGFVTLKDYFDVQILCQTIHWSRPEQALVSLAPEPRDIYWSNLTISSTALKMRNAFVLLCMGLLYGFWATPVTFLAKLMSYDALVSLLNPEFVRWIEKSGTLKALIQNSLPTLAIIIFNALLPFFLDWLSTVQGLKSKSLIEYSLMKKYHLFLLITVLFIFVAVSTVSLLRDLRDNPGQLIDKIASSLPGARYFFISYLMLQSLAIIPLQLLQLPNLFARTFYRLVGGTQTPRSHSEMKNMHLEVLSLGTIYPQALLVFTICITYSVIAPTILIFGMIYFGLAYLVYKYKVLNVYYRPFESRGQAWPIACNRIGWGMIIFQVFMFGLLSLRQAFLLSTLVLPLIVYTVYQLIRLYSVYAKHAKFISLSQICEARNRTPPGPDLHSPEAHKAAISNDDHVTPRESSVTPSQTNLNVQRYSRVDQSLYISGKDLCTDNSEPPMSTVFNGVLDTGRNYYAHPAIYGRMPMPQLPVVRTDNVNLDNETNGTPPYRDSPEVSVTVQDSFGSSQPATCTNAQDGRNPHLLHQVHFDDDGVLQETGDSTQINKGKDKQALSPMGGQCALNS